MKRPLVILLVLLALPAVSSACIWDTDTIQDELKQNATTFHVITEQYARHGEAYYRARLARSQDELKRAPESIETLYDIGAAHLRLGEYEKAREAFLQVESIAPDRYKTHANLSALCGAMGDYEHAYEHMEKALAKNPAAHFGAGWLHLKMVEWQGTLWETGEPGVNFLGVPYETHGSRLHRVARDRAETLGVELEDFDGVKLLSTLLRANPDFADGYFVLGKLLESKFDLNLALRAYLKAKSLDHPRPDAIDEHIDWIFDHWKEAIEHAGQGKRLESKADATRKIQKELEAGRLWGPAFVAHEAKLVAAGRDLPDFDAVRASMAQAGLKRLDPVPAGILGTGGSGSPANGKQAPGRKRARNAPAPVESKDKHASLPAPTEPRSSRPIGNASPVHAGDPVSHTLEPKGSPWFVWFGLGMLAVSLFAVVIGSARSA